MEKESKRKKAIRKARKTSAAIQQKSITLILGGFGLVAVLAWNEAIKSLFENLFKDKGSIISKFAYAGIVTIIVVLVSMHLQKSSNKDKR
jgi:NADH:ubiquinone oxidoreductase subunit H